MNVRIAIVSVVSAVSLAVGATAAVAAPVQYPHHQAERHHRPAGRRRHLHRPGHGVEDGSQVTLQVKDGGGWQSLPGARPSTRAPTGSTRASNDEGVSVVRVQDGRAVSESVSIKVETQAPGQR